MNYDKLIEFIQGHFTDGLLLVIGSGLSVAEGMSGMKALGEHLSNNSASLSKTDKSLWGHIKSCLDNDEGLEAAMLKHAPSDTLEEWVVKQTCALLLGEEVRILAEVASGTRTLRLTRLLEKILKPIGGLPILTPNYDRLIEVACEMAGFHVDTTAIGHYAGVFNHERSCMGSCRGIKTVAKKYCS